MKKNFIAWFFLFGLFSHGFAQSGRRITTAPTPAPKTAETQITESQAAETQTPEYSESVSNKPRRVYAPPTFRVGADGKPATSGSRPNQTANAPVLNGTPGDDEIVKVETNLITIPVSVFDRNGLYIPNLKQESFKILENGVEQEIAYFGSSEKPFTVVLLLDTSPSTEYKIEDIQRAAIAFLDQLKPHDRVMVIEFDANVHVLTEPTGDRQRIYKAIGKADFGGGTSLYSAVDVSLKKHLGRIEGRKAIVLFTDGVDTTSGRASYDSTINQAEESDALIFPIYYNTFFDNGRAGRTIYSPFPLPGDTIITRGETAEEYALGRQYLDELAAVTGGRVFRPEATPGGLTLAFEGIAEELRRQYNIGYYPREEGAIGQRKQIKIRVNRPNLIVRSRDSYIVGAGTKSPPVAAPAKTQK